MTTGEQSASGRESGAECPWRYLVARFVVPALLCVIFTLGAAWTVRIDDPETTRVVVDLGYAAAPDLALDGSVKSNVDGACRIKRTQTPRVGVTVSSVCRALKRRDARIDVDCASARIEPMDADPCRRATTCNEPGSLVFVPPTDAEARGFPYCDLTYGTRWTGASGSNGMSAQPHSLLRYEVTGESTASPPRAWWDYVGWRFAAFFGLFLAFSVGVLVAGALAWEAAGALVAKWTRRLEARDPSKRVRMMEIPATGRAQKRPRMIEIPATGPAPKRPRMIEIQARGRAQGTGRTAGGEV